MSMRDLPVIFGTILMLGIGVITAQTIVDQFQASNDQIDAKYMNKAEDALSLMDGGVVFATAGMYMVSLIFAYRIRTSPIFFVPSLLFLIVSLWISAEFANIFWQVANAAALVDAANQFPMIIEVFKNATWIAGGFGVALMIVMYTKSGESSKGRAGV